MAAEASLRPTPEVVGEADRVARTDSRPLADRHGPADQRQPEATVVHAERAAGEDRVEELARPVGESAEISARRSMGDGQLDLLDAQACSESVDRHPDLAAEACCEREAGPAGGGRQRPLTRERLPGGIAAARLHERTRRALRDAEAAALPLCERGDREVGIRLEQRAQIPAQVGVADDESSGRGLPLGERERLALASPPKTDD